MDPQQFDENPPSPSQQQQPDLHENSHNHSDHDAESVQENCNEEINTGFDKDLGFNTEGN